MDMEYVIVRFLKSLDEKFRGVDGRVYGPYKKGQLVALPKENASLLIKQGYVERARKEAKKPTLKEVFKGEVLTGYVEAARVKPLTEIFRKEEDKRKELIEKFDELLRRMRRRE